MLALGHPLAGMAAYLVVALLWLVPDRRAERFFAASSGE